MLFLLLAACAGTPQNPQDQPSDEPAPEPPSDPEPPPQPPVPPVAEVAVTDGADAVATDAVASDAGAPPTKELPPGKPGKDPPPCPRIEQALWPNVKDAAPVQVVVDTAGPVTLPPSFQEEARTPVNVQGTLPGTDLCLVGEQANVVRVRRPVIAQPKVP